MIVAAFSRESGDPADRRFAAGRLIIIPQGAALS